MRKDGDQLVQKGEGKINQVALFSKISGMVVALRKALILTSKIRTVCHKRQCVSRSAWLEPLFAVRVSALHSPRREGGWHVPTVS